MLKKIRIDNLPGFTCISQYSSYHTHVYLSIHPCICLLSHLYHTAMSISICLLIVVKMLFITNTGGSTCVFHVLKLQGEKWNAHVTLPDGMSLRMLTSQWFFSLTTTESSDFSCFLATAVTSLVFRGREAKEKFTLFDKFFIAGSSKKVCIYII